MTAREIYEAVLVEVNKENAPTFTIEEFNYLLNKSVLALTNEKYNFYAANQQLSDDLRVLLKTAEFGLETDTFNAVRGTLVNDVITAATEAKVSSVSDISVGDIIKLGDSSVEATVNAVDTSSYPYTLTLSDGPEKTITAGAPIYIKTPQVSLTQYIDGFDESDMMIPVVLPSSDYLHMLSCRVVQKGNKPYPTDSTTTYLTFPAKRLTFDIYNFIENNVYLRPAPNRPYYQVFDNYLNSGMIKTDNGTPLYKEYQNKPTVNVYLGRQRATLNPYMVKIDYLKLPEPIILDDVDIFTAGADTSQALEFPDYLKNEIVRRITDYLLEKTRDPRVQTHPAFNQEIPMVPMNMQQEAVLAQKQRAVANQNNQTNQ